MFNVQFDLFHLLTVLLFFFLKLSPHLGRRVSDLLTSKKGRYFWRGDHYVDHGWIDGVVVALFACRTDSLSHKVSCVESDVFLVKSHLDKSHKESRD